MKTFKRFVKDDAGATAIEYGLIAAATGLVLVAVGPALTANLTTVFDNINNGLTSAAAPAAP